MKKYVVPLILSLFTICRIVYGQEPIIQYSIEEIYQQMLTERDSTQLFQITYPDDSSTFAVDKVRYGAWTWDTTATITVNGVADTIYASGAFTGLLTLQPGWNQFPFYGENERGTHEDILHLYRIPPVVSLPPRPTSVLDTLMFPYEDLVYYAPDKIILRFVGSPGGKAHFRIWGLTKGDLSMVELPPERARGLEGVYEGVYYIKETDQCRDKRVVFKLTGSNGKKVKKKSHGRITVRQKGQPKLVETTASSNLVFNAIGGEILMDSPAGIIFQAIADLGRWWKIRISEQKVAYISKHVVKEIPTGMDPPQAALYGISTEIDSNWVTMQFNLSEKIPFNLTQHTDPQRLSVHFYRTHFQDEWTVYPYPDSLIDHFDWVQQDNDVLRFDIYFNADQQWGFKGWFEETTFYLAMRVPPKIGKSSLFANLTIALDAGHGGEHRGAVGSTGLMEKDVNLVYAHYLAKMLSDAGARVVLTRPDDRTMSLKARIDIAREAEAHLLLWLHNNSTGWIRHPLEIKGTSTYYTHLQGWPFARKLYPHLLGLDLEPAGTVHRSYYITRQTDMPIYLVEGAFHSNPYDEMFLMRDENLKKLSRAVYDGLEEYLLELAE